MNYIRRIQHQMRIIWHYIHEDAEKKLFFCWIKTTGLAWKITISAYAHTIVRFQRTFVLTPIRSLGHMVPSQTLLILSF